MDWARCLKDMLQAEFDFKQRPLRLVTGCSGAEAPHWTLNELIGNDDFVHICLDSRPDDEQKNAENTMMSLDL